MRIATWGAVNLVPDYLDQLAALADGRRLDSNDPEVVLVSTLDPMTGDDIAQWPSLRHVVVCGTSKGRLDLATLAERGIEVHNVTHYGDHPAAEVVMMQLVALARGLGQYQWREHPHELAGKRCTIVGLGDLGRSVADLALAFGMHVSHISRQPRPDLEARGVEHGDRDRLLPLAEVVVLTGPTDVEVLSAADFEVIPDGAVLVQASGGDAFDHQGFLSWIARPGNHAIFDLGTGEQVYERYARLPRVIFPRVVAGLSRETLERLGRAVVDIVLSLG
ncbi:NAD(P)-dependent oxidoreductase [Aestuariimicrobium ganziense]|uniref:NAD(P)-dependent oxidoreductase n=1 Tax=Aestuariimicrobium ganziense TaxID=2773677 RepID=UPI0019408B8B|nr:NAD(P)-dependent oxidoreductase [Aestuariimicrobium ganziense]